MVWAQNYDPLGNAVLSTAAAAVPVAVLLGTIALGRVKIHVAALAGLAVALAVAGMVYRLPLSTALAAAGYGAATGLFPIGWIILNLMFLYDLTVQRGGFDVLRRSLGAWAPDPRLQVILIAFCLGAFFEGAAGFGTPVAVAAALLIGLGFSPLESSVLALMANTAPVAYGALGTPILALSQVTGLDSRELAAMVGRQLPLFSLLTPFWLVWTMSGWRGMLGVWPAALAAGLGFALPQYLVATLHGPWLVDLVAAASSAAALGGVLLVWRPRPDSKRGRTLAPETAGASPAPPWAAVARAWLPWLLLSLCVFAWGLPPVKRFLNGERTAPSSQAGAQAALGGTRLSFRVWALDNRVCRAPPVARSGAAPEPAVYALDWLSATGTGILVAAVLAGAMMGYSARDQVRNYGRTMCRIRYSLVTIAAMLALGYVTRYAGADATLGLALAKTGPAYPFFGTLLGWLGVALTGSDTASNVLFGSLQQITAHQTGLNPVLMASANATGGVMGKMVDAQSLVVASTATNWYGHEGAILRRVFPSSLALASLVGLVVLCQARVGPLIAGMSPGR